MRFLNLQIIKNNRYLEVKRPNYEFSHYIRLIETQKKELRELRDEGEAEMERMEAELEDLKGQL